MLMYFKVLYWTTDYFNLAPQHYKWVNKTIVFSPDLNLHSMCYFQFVLLTYFQELSRHVCELWCAQTGPEWLIKLTSVSGWVAGNNGGGVCSKSDTGKRKWSQQMSVLSFPFWEINIISVSLLPGSHLTIIPFPFTLIRVRSHVTLLQTSRN